jgi:hypothetical protein
MPGAQKERGNFSLCFGSGFPLIPDPYPDIWLNPGSESRLLLNPDPSRIRIKTIFIIITIETFFDQNPSYMSS